METLAARPEPAAGEKSAEQAPAVPRTAKRAVRESFGEQSETGKSAESQDRPVLDKRGYAARWLFSPRHIDHLITQGLPHLAIGTRRVRIFVDEADAWMRARYGVQRRTGKKATKAGQA